MRNLLPVLLLSVSWGCLAVPLAAAEVPIDWDASTLRLLHPGATYGRMERLTDGSVLCCFEKTGRSWVMRSEDEIKTWSTPVKVAAFSAGAAANPELCTLRDGRVLLFWNERPRQQNGQHAYTIRLATSRNSGRTWQARPTPVFTAGNTKRSACWEPAAIESPDGKLRLFFSREVEGGQEIAAMQSHNAGTTWTPARRASFRPGHRDGMPVPVVLSDGRCVFSIEDNGLGGADRRFRPTIVEAATGKRRSALGENTQPDSILAAPYLAKLPTGETLLSVQASTGDLAQKRMAVYLGARDATEFSPPTFPFARRNERDCLWNSLFVLDANRIIALSNTHINGQSGLWAITGRVKSGRTNTGP